MYLAPTTLNCLPQISYALYGTGSAARELLKEIKNRGLRLPEIIIEHQSTLAEFEGIRVVDINKGVNRKIPVVLGSPTFGPQMQERLLRASQNYLEIIDVFHSPPQHSYKVFCIGYGKTGTSSLERALRELGYVMGSQPQAEMLIDDWAQRDFKRIIEFCETADAFQDIPFCLDFTYQALDTAYLGSKFVLTVRDSPQQWFDSLVKFHTKKFTRDKLAPPTEEDLKNVSYRCPRYVWKSSKYVYGEGPLYEREYYQARYSRHIANVEEYFRHRPKDLLILNVAHNDAYKQLCTFLGKEPVRDGFPWENKTSEAADGYRS